METLASFFSIILQFFQLPITIYGFTFSYWDVFLFTLASSIVISFIGGVMYGD